MRIFFGILLCLVVALTEAEPRMTSSRKGNEEWGYVTVRENAHMFWWLYNCPSKNPRKNNVVAPTTPLVLWLQGGPGGSGTGFGNFAEIGPLDVNLNPRNTTWLNKASLLFVDNPVGTGFSYVTDPNAYATTVDQIAEDLVILFQELYGHKPELQTAPLYIFSESYGGKMAAVFAVHLWKAIQRGQLIAKFRGVAMGDSWVYPELIVNSWGSYLYSTSVVDQTGREVIDASARNISAAIAAQDWSGATNLWDASEGIVASVTSGVDWYNILNPLAAPAERLKQSRNVHRSSYHIRLPSVKRLYRRHFSVHQNDALDVLMNEVIREKLGIIPANVTWGGQSADVFSHQANEFMKPVTYAVDYLLMNTALKVVVYNGQLDLICDSIGVEAWVQTLAWPGLPAFNAALRQPVALEGDDYIVGFVKKYKLFSFYWMLRGGHMLPADQGPASLRMLDLIINQK